MVVCDLAHDELTYSHDTTIGRALYIRKSLQTPFVFSSFLSRESGLSSVNEDVKHLEKHWFMPRNSVFYNHSLREMCGLPELKDDEKLPM